MKREIAMQWADALESGEYRQCRGQLRKVVKGKSSFCCLGVLCNLHAQAHPEIAAHETDPTEYLGEDEFPPTQVNKWAGIKDAKVYFTFARQLVYMNDNNKLNFKNIAKFIRENYRSL